LSWQLLRQIVSNVTETASEPRLSIEPFDEKARTSTPTNQLSYRFASEPKTRSFKVRQINPAP